MMLIGLSAASTSDTPFLEIRLGELDDQDRVLRRRAGVHLRRT